MRKAPSNLFADRPAPKSSPGASSTPSKSTQDRSGKKSDKPKDGIWVGVHEINEMSKASMTRPRSAKRLRQEELMTLGAKGPKNGGTPMKIGRAMAIKKRQLAVKLKMRDRDLGNYVAPPKKDGSDTKLERDEYLRKLKGNRSGLSRGNRVNTDALVGSYKDGVLTIPKSEIEAMRSKKRK